MRGYHMWPTKKQRPESWRALVARHLEISAIADPSAKAFPRCVFMSERDIGFITRERDRPSLFCQLCFAGWRRKGLSNERHCQSEKNGSRAKKGETMKKKKIVYKPFD